MTIRYIRKADIDQLAKKLSKEAITHLPADLTKSQKDYIINKLYNFCFLAGEALIHDEDINLAKKEAYCIVQLIEKWTFHKNIDLIRANVPEDCWEPVLKQVAFAVFETAKTIEIKRIEQNQAQKMIENAVKDSYNASLMELARIEKIKEEDLPEVLSHSNADKISRKSQNHLTSKIKNNIKKFIKYLLERTLFITTFLFAVCVIFLIIYIFYLFITGGIPFIIKNIKPILLVVLIFAVVLKGFSWIVKRDVDKQLKKLEQIKQDMQDLIDPNMMYCRLGVDILRLEVGYELLRIADPELEGQLLAKVAALRQRMTDELGYIIPNIRVVDSTELNPKEYNILVRNIIVEQGVVYPDRVMITCEEIEKENFVLPEDAIADVDPVSKKSIYWIKPDQIDKTLNLIMVDPCDVMIAHIKESVINNANEIITLEYTAKLVEYVEEKCPVCVKNLIPSLIPLVDLQKILINLVRERVSIKDTVYIFEKLCDYARFSNDPDILSEKLRFSLRKYICAQYLDKDKNLSAIILPDNYEKIFEEFSHIKEQDFKFDSIKFENLIKFITFELDKAGKTAIKQPVILCPQKLRLFLFRLLNKYFNSIVVLSEKEIEPDINILKLG